MAATWTCRSLASWKTANADRPQKSIGSSEAICVEASYRMSLPVPLTLFISGCHMKHRHRRRPRRFRRRRQQSDARLNKIYSNCLTQSSPPLTMAELWRAVEMFRKYPELRIEVPPGRILAPEIFQRAGRRFAEFRDFTFREMAARLGLPIDQDVPGASVGAAMTTASLITNLINKMTNHDHP